MRALRPEMGISPELEAAMVKALQKQPRTRFESAESFDQALALTPEVQPRRRTTNQLAVLARSEPRLPALPSPPTSELLIDAPGHAARGPNWTLLLILGGVALVVVVVVVLFLTGLLSA